MENSSKRIPVAFSSWSCQLKWIKEKYNFKAGEEKLKEEVFEILK
jgi:hypothetical protein